MSKQTFIITHFGGPRRLNAVSEKYVCHLPPILSGTSDFDQQTFTEWLKNRVVPSKSHPDNDTPRLSLPLY